MTHYRTHTEQIKAIKKIIVLAFALILGVVNAQPFDYGVQRTTDEFTGVQSCFQRVDNGTSDDSGISLSYSTNPNLGVIVWIHRDWRNDPDTWVFSSSRNAPYDNDLVYIRWPDGTVDQMKPDYVNVDTDLDQEAVAWWKADSLARKIARTEGEIRVRFSGTHGSRDFSINTGVTDAFRGNFIGQCINQ